MPSQRPRRPTRSAPPSVRPEDSSFSDLIERRLRNQGLVAGHGDSPEAAVARLGAVQAQDYLGAKWAIAQRAGDCTDLGVEEAFNRGAILRTHVLRPTWHFVAPADIRWLLALSASRVHALNAPYCRQVGLDAPVLARSDAVLAKALQGRQHLTRDEMRAALLDAGIRADGLRLALLLMHAELEAIVCSGPRRGKQLTYAALDERAPAARGRSTDEARAELARRYFSGHGPARAQDFAWWSGLRVGDAQEAIEMLGAEVESWRSGKDTYWVAAGGTHRRPRREGPRVRLLPSYDEYVIGYRNHAPIVEAGHATTLNIRGGFVGAAVILVDGRVAGSWRRTLERRRVTVDAGLLVPLEAAARSALEREAERYGRFLSLPVHLNVTVPPRARRPSRRSPPSVLPG